MRHQQPALHGNQSSRPCRLSNQLFLTERRSFARLQPARPPTAAAGETTYTSQCPMARHELELEGADETMHHLRTSSPAQTGGMFRPYVMMVIGTVLMLVSTLGLSKDGDGAARFATLPPSLTDHLKLPPSSTLAPNAPPTGPAEPLSLPLSPPLPPLLPPLSPPLPSLPPPSPPLPMLPPPLPVLPPPTPLTPSISTSAAKINARFRRSPHNSHWLSDGSLVDAAVLIHIFDNWEQHDQCWPGESRPCFHHWIADVRTDVLIMFLSMFLSTCRRELRSAPQTSTTALRPLAQVHRRPHMSCTLLYSEQQSPVDPSIPIPVYQNGFVTDGTSMRRVWMRAAPSTRPRPGPDSITLPQA